MFGIFKRRRMAREAAAEAERKALRDRVSLADRRGRIAARQEFVQPGQPGKSMSIASSPQYASRGDDSLGISSPLHPLNPLNPLNIVSPAEAYAPRHDPEPARSHCSTSVSDDSWSRSSSSDSCSSSSWGGSDSSSSSSYDSGSSSSYDSSSSY